MILTRGHLWPHQVRVMLSQVVAEKKKVARKPADTVQLKLRFLEALRRRLERAAKSNDQSLNAEIISRLEQSFRKEDDANRVAQGTDALSHLTPTQLGPALYGLYAFDTPEGRIAARAALATAEGRTAALRALRVQRQGSPPALLHTPPKQKD